MNISALASIISLLLPTATYADTAQPVPSPHIPGKTDPGDDEILRRHSTYAGIRMAFDMQNLIDHAAASYLTDREAIRQALLNNLDNAPDIEKHWESSKALEQEYTAALGREQKERDKTFLQENAKRPGIATLPIGIQYKVIPDPEGNNRSIEEMDCLKRASTLGRFFGSFSGLAAIHGLPPILRHSTALQNMPKGREWTLYIPVRLLSPNERAQIENSASVLVCTICKKQGENEKEYSAQPIPASRGTYARIPANLSRRYEENQGKLVAAFAQASFKEMAAKDIDPALARAAFIAHIGKDIDAEALDREYKESILRYDAIHKTRETARDKRFIEENAKKPGVTVLSNGIQYAVEKDPEGRNITIDKVQTAVLSTISGHDTLNLNNFRAQDIFGDAADSLPRGKKWTACIPFGVLDESEQSTLKAVWEKQPEYVVFTCEAAETASSSPDTDADIEDDAPAAQPTNSIFPSPPPIDAKTLASEEAEFLKMNALTPNVTVLDNGVQYSYIIDPKGNNGSIQDVHIMEARALTGESIETEGAMNRSVAKAHFHPELWPYIDALPKAKQWFFCIPSHLINPKSLDEYTQKIGVRPNYILYTCEWSPPKEDDAEQSE